MKNPPYRYLYRYFSRCMTSLSNQILLANSLLSKLKVRSICIIYLYGLMDEYYDIVPNWIWTTPNLTWEELCQKYKRSLRFVCMQWRIQGCLGVWTPSENVSVFNVTQNWKQFNVIFFLYPSPQKKIPDTPLHIYIH